MSDINEISSMQRAAIIITAIGTDNAADVYKHLSDDEVEKLTFEVSSLPFYDSNTVDSILNEFYELCLTEKVMTDGGVDYARDVLEKAFGRETAERLMAKVSNRMKTKSFEFVRKSDYKNLLAIVQNEYPQTIALILSYATAEQASQVLAELPKEKRVDVVERMAKMDSTSPETIRAIESMLERKFSAAVTMDTTEVGGINFVADVLNKVDRANEKFIFDELTARDPVLVDEIKKKMFVFEDIVGLDSMAIQRFIRECETKDLAIAIKGSNNTVAAALYANMPQRMQESIQQEIEYMHNIRMRDVEEAQQRIVGIIRHLEEEGELVISKGGDDEIIA
ncbi:MAG: flagellar motor switch protein FliG [Oscillospiraceae bacterium]|nr:flagellar motor switch protein FliG [Oscillospiraceae bacterium]MDY2846660.1 flagellar motor switch protein FliG [Oscillospiraceae bacterium]